MVREHGERIRAYENSISVLEEAVEKLQSELDELNSTDSNTFSDER